MRQEVIEDLAYCGHFLFPMTANGRGYGKVYLLQKEKDEVVRIAEMACDENEVFVQDEQTVTEISRLTSFSYKDKIKERDKYSGGVWLYTDTDCQRMVEWKMEELRSGEVIGFIVPKNWRDPKCYLWNEADSTPYAVK